MSLALILVIVIGGTVLIAGAVTWFVVWNNRSLKARGEQAMARLGQEAERRGWRYEERNDSYCSLFGEGDHHVRRTVVEEIADPRDPLLGRLNAYEAHQVITGTHRGWPFLAAVFKVRALDSGWNDVRAIWVRTPVAGPALQVTPAVPLASRVNAGLGQGDLRVGDPDFDDRYEVRTGDERFARAVLAPAVIEFLKTDQRQHRGFTLLGGKLDFLDRVADHRDPRELVPALDLRCDLLDRVPRSVWA
ncbi:hypothetical protein [Amycolatopsis saalfeldensis]|uniref:Uncharacterized protein n=1 Tax=Amycolatopsis saalfeldensis TaxID=394193 RepID=A0A1H8YHJ2_9PSEU|nr:hypothetical protein [Amycolatopsis saalfeldensis]SEP51629.1 hypothetical protein SAMN04489732_116171 [Amycolatopsis saalfeldensis]